MTGYLRIHSHQRLGDAGGIAAHPPVGRFDFIMGDLNPNSLTGTEGADTILAGGGADTVEGRGGADSIGGDSGNDTLYGQDGDDTLVGGDNDDLLIGGDGNDLLIGVTGADIMRGGAGADTLRASNPDQLPDLDGGTGDDVIVVDHTTVDFKVVGGAGVDTLVVTGDVTFTGNYDAELQGIELVIGPVNGDSGDNVLDFSGAHAGDLDVKFYGGLGEDHIIDMDDGDDLNGGGQNDRLEGRRGADRLFGESGDDSLNGGDGDDTLDGGGANDTLIGGGGKDVLVIKGDAIGRGGGGDDLFNLGACDIADGAIDAGKGTDSIRVGGSTDVSARVLDLDRCGFEVFLPDAPFSATGDISHLIDVSGVDLGGGYTGAKIFGDGGPLMAPAGLAAGLAPDDTLIGSVGDDTIAGFGGSDLLNGSFGADLVRGGDGNDILIASEGDDQLFGEAGIDLVSFGFAIVSITFDLSVQTAQATGVGSKTVTGVENLAGGRGADHLSGDASANVITGGKGADTMAGGGGDDRFAIGEGDSTRGHPDLITDLNAGDVVDISGIDANRLKAGDQAFKLVGHFGGRAGQAVLFYDAGADLTILAMDVNGDGKADDIVHFSGDHTGFTGFVL